MAGRVDELEAKVREGIGAGKQAWFSGRYSDDGVLLGDMTADEWNEVSQAGLAALSELAVIARDGQRAAEVVRTARRLAGYKRPFMGEAFIDLQAAVRDFDAGVE